ncbi:all7174 (plasmid) [Nostoc sp. PCC 7120 = FACHB-418]|nr:all7174 [Nostoc sp. PCC 7120 = FACHB-418]
MESAYRERVMKSSYRIKTILMLWLVGLLLVLGLTIPVRLAIANHQAPQPQAILTLGGGADKEEFTALFAQFYPDIKIWVSSGIEPQQARAIFHAAGITDSQFHLDYRATDTVTNFTSLVEDFQQQHIKHIFLITSKFHMPRAKAIATLVLGSRGISFTSISVPSRATRAESTSPTPCGSR